MLKAWKLFIALVFIAHSLTASFWIHCQAPGPGSHDRVEFAFDACCTGYAGHASTSSTSPTAACSTDSYCCGDCRDELIHTPDAVRPSVEHVSIPLVCTLPTVLPLQSSATLPPGFCKAAVHPDDPPLFLIHHAFRI